MAESFVSRLTAGRKEIHASKSEFFISGFAFATWVMMIPAVKQRLAIEADALSLLLLCIGVSACIAMPLAGLLTRYATCRQLITGASLLAAAAVAVLPHLPSYGAHVPVLLLLGGSVGTLDVAINLNAVLVERACGERIYSRHYLDYHADGSGKKTALPRGIVVFLGVLCCISFLAEGGVMDWGGVLLSEDKGIPLAQAGLGLTAFSVAEFLARLPGDRLVHRFGEKKVILASTVSAAVCFAAVGWAETLPPLIVFFFLLGLSVANVVPVLYSLLEYQTVMPINLAVAALTSMGYAGILLGPAFLGFVAHHTHIAVVFDFLAALVLCQTALALYIFARMRK